MPFFSPQIFDLGPFHLYVFPLLPLSYFHLAPYNTSLLFCSLYHRLYLSTTRPPYYLFILHSSLVLPPGSLQNKLATLFTTVSPLVPTHPYSTTLPTPQSPLNPFPLFCLRKATWFQQATILLFSRPRQSTPFFMMQQIWK